MKRGVESRASYVGFYSGMVLFAFALTLAAIQLWVLAVLAFVVMVAAFALWGWAVLGGDT